jgi:dipeptidyl aminopeptidase/acylaminoacyl peptidase
LIALVLPLLLLAQATPAYKRAPEAIRKVLDAPLAPSLSLSPNGDYLTFASQQRYPAVADLARPSLKLAGLRLDPATNGPQRLGRITGVKIRRMDSDKLITLDVPEKHSPSSLSWSPDGKRFAMLCTSSKGIDLFLGTPDDPKLTAVPGLRINTAYGSPMSWLSDSKTLLVQAIPAKRGKPPIKDAKPVGPVIQESDGKAAPVRTFQDLLKDAHDEDLFDYYCTSQLMLVDVTTLKATALGKPAVFEDVTPAPDGKHVLISRHTRPYSYLLPAAAFAKIVEVWNLNAEVVYKVADLPVADKVPIEGVPTGPRSEIWHPLEPATLVWVEALDDGDPRKKVKERDVVRSLASPFKGEPNEIARTTHRFSGLAVGEKGLLLLSDFDRETRKRRTIRLDGADKGKVIFDRSIQDRYGDPGTPIARRLPTGQSALRQEGDLIYLAGAGASPKGDRPFLDRYDLKTGKATRLFQSTESALENFAGFVGADTSKFLTRHESPSSPPNYRLRSIGKDDFVALTTFTDPAPQLREIQRKLVRYKRADGVPLSFTLYLPPGYKEGTKLPTLVWAYPREFNDASTAGQVVGSPNRFTNIGGASHLFFLLAGYAVLDEATMPVVGSPEKANDTFLEQITDNAKAAIEKAVELGVTDPDRVAVAGHSYGAFMTANLLAHTDLFRAGIARSGAYNRTLTPFGFQNERRTLWEAPEIYAKMSPFMHAQKINEPILLIHGEADNNPGTFPIQSDRLYQAIRGNGGTVRYVSLPFESHGYQGRESIEHTISEMIEWCDRHVKNAEPRKKTEK